MSLLTKDTIEGLNRNPRTLIIGLEVAAKQKMLDYEDAIKNNNEREAEKLNAEINEIDERIIEVKAELGEESYEEMRKGNAEGGLTGNQTKIDMNKDGKISSEDFELLRKAEGGDIDGQMTMLMMSKEPEEEMLSDDEMEDEYLDFILDEALDNEEENYLMEMLQGNDRLSEIFDKVIDIAQEFAGSGPVEGPGSGVSDSIPARLSDGEFVFTAKAVEEIGADNLMAMMKDAEMKADGRQDLAEGGQPEEEEETVEMPVEKPASRQDIRVVKTTVDNGGKGLLDEDEISKSIKSKMMLDNRTGRHVQS
jgi:hypothetical protein